MNNFIITIITPYTEIHGGMDFSLLCNLCDSTGWKCIAFSSMPLDYNQTLHHPLIKIIAAPNGKMNNLRDSNISDEWKENFMTMCSELSSATNIFHFQDVFTWNFLTNKFPKAYHHVFIRHFYTEMLSFEKDYASKVPNTSVLYENDYKKFVHLTQIEKDYMNNATTIAVASPSLKHRLKSIFKVNPSVYLVESFSTKIPKIAPSPRPNVAKDINYMFLGRMDFQKGYSRILHLKDSLNIEIQTSASLFHQRPNAQFTDINFTNIKNESTINIAMFPAIYETRGMVLQECMAAGMLPVVQYNIPGLVEQIDHNRTGILVDFDDDWTKVIDKIVPEEMVKMCIDARNSIIKKAPEHVFRNSITDHLNKLGKIYGAI